MHTWQAVLYILAVILLVFASFPLPYVRVSVAALAAATALLAYALPVIATVGD